MLVQFLSNSYIIKLLFIGLCMISYPLKKISKIKRCDHMKPTISVPSSSPRWDSKKRKKRKRKTKRKFENTKTCMFIGPNVN